MPAEPPQDKEPIFPETEFQENQKPKRVKDRLMEIYYDSMPLFNLNVAWFLSIIPLVTILPAQGGLYHAVLNYNQNKPAKWNNYWEGIKDHWFLSLKWGAVVLLGDLLLVLNIWFSLNIDAAWSIYTLLVGLVIGFIWIAINQFSFPLLLLQEEKKILQALRNGYVIVVRRPWDTLKVVLLNLLITAVSIIIPPLWVFITMSLIVHVQTRAVLRALEKIRAQDTGRDAADKQAEGTEDKETES